MSEPFIAEIRIIACNFAPRGWAFCEGQLLPISQNTALFSLVGTTFGGDGHTTMGLPNLQGRIPMHPGRGPGLTSRRLGDTGGEEQVTLSEAQIPNHTHTFVGSSNPADSGDPQGHTLARPIRGNLYQTDTSSNLTPLNQADLPATGGSLPHNNIMPVLGLHFSIALVGLYPSRS